MMKSVEFELVFTHEFDSESPLELLGVDSLFDDDASLPLKGKN